MVFVLNFSHVEALPKRSNFLDVDLAIELKSQSVLQPKILLMLVVASVV